MSSAEYRQDMPPPGGYAKFNWFRTYPKPFWKAEKIAAIALAVAGFGIYQGIAIRKTFLTEKMEDRDLYLAMQPFIYAERDRKWLAMLKRNRDLEDKLVEISGDKNWVTGTWYGEPVYFTLRNRWWDPSPHEVFAHSPPRSYIWEMEFPRRPDYVEGRIA